MIKNKYQSEKLSYCIVWTSIPMLSYIFPLIGHVGICNSKGQICDFVGGVNIDNFSFGRPLKYTRLYHDENVNAEQYDKMIDESNMIYDKKNHNLFTTNCYDHVCYALNLLGYQDKKWTRIQLAFLMMRKSHYVDQFAKIATYLPFLILLTLIIITLYFVTKF